MTTPSAGDVESLIEALQPILAKCEQYDRKENAWSKRYSDGFTVGISLGTCRRIRAAITSHDTAIVLRRALAKCREVAKREYDFARAAEEREGKNPYREGAADAACEIMNDINNIVDAALKEGAE